MLIKQLQNVTIILALIFCTNLNAAKDMAQLYFDSPEAAIKALIESVKEKDKNRLIKILGIEAKPLIDSGDEMEDQAKRLRFLQAFNEKNQLERKAEGKVVLLLGKEDWPFPIPLVREAKGWFFDIDAGKEEMFNRRIGRNEFLTIKAILAYLEAQQEYYLNNPQQEPQASYASELLSTEGKRDGLYYPVKTGEVPSPLTHDYTNGSNEFGESQARDPEDPIQPYFGYFYRILKSQGNNAKGGAYDYIVNGKMVGGHALIAWPANYGNTGIMTFIVNQQGKIFEKDLGQNTNQIVRKIKAFNPDKSWNVIKETKE